VSDRSGVASETSGVALDASCISLGGSLSGSSRTLLFEGHCGLPHAAAIQDGSRRFS
jgi:hypothetical protein